ncbi:MAG: aminoacyl-tRNA hydrolase [Leptospiraceae bacterium]|nr:aminoacyl-tRNA hydrolase [Leptospiraceae bacterium]
MSGKLLIAGLGNPGDKYNGTRHSIGFAVIDKFADKFGASFNSDKKCPSTEILSHDKKVILIKPFEYMNLSGNGVALFMRKNGIIPSQLLVIHDEIDFEFAKCKMKIGGGHAGHNGLRDIIAKIGTADFHRLRVGVTKPTDGRVVADYVLSKFTPDEKTKLNEIYETCLQKIQDWIRLT